VTLRSVWRAVLSRDPNSQWTDDVDRPGAGDLHGTQALATPPRGGQNGWTESGAARAFASAEIALRAAGIGWRAANEVEDRFKELQELPFRTPEGADCSLRGCAEGAITNSHALSKGAHISPLLDEKEKVWFPDLRSPRRVRLYDVVASKASVFPGYCLEHERLFAGFENAGFFRNDQDRLRQLMRSAAREEWKATRDQNRLEQLVAVVEHGLDCLTATHEEEEYWRTQLMSPLRNWYAHLDVRRAYALWNHVDLTAVLDEDVMPPWTWAVRYPSKLKVALSGSFHIGFQRPWTMLLVAVPDGDQTALMLASSTDDADALQAFIAQRCSTDADRDALICT
jgi:hypothetical protein